jgi:tetratricopeptide (TPR) repeat protein
LRRGRPELAEAFLRRAVEVEKTNAGYRLDLGQCLLFMGRVVEADEHYARARAIAPGHPRVNWQWGPSPIFVIGLPRSGTTLVSEILAAHDQVGNAGEIETMTWIAAMMRGAHPLARMEQTLAEQGPERMRALASTYQKVTAHLAAPKPRSVDKMPNNFLYLAEIAILFPGARFIDCTRHPADTFISAIQTEMNEAHAYTHELADFALYHRHHRRLMQH